MEVIRHKIEADGTHADLEKVTIRLPQPVAYQVQALARAKRQSVSLYMARLLEKHVKVPE